MEKKQKNSEINDPGLCYEPGPLTQEDRPYSASTWRPIGPGSCWNRDRHWSRVMDPGSATGTNGPNEPVP
jgi:hypothetical protein